MKLHNVLARAVAGCGHLLRDLAASGIAIGIVSTRERERIELAAELLPEIRLSAVIVAKEDVSQCKPSPEAVLLALDSLGVAAETALFVGDTDNDVVAAAEAGVQVFIVGERCSDAVVHRHSDFVVGNVASAATWADAVRLLVLGSKRTQAG